MDLTGAHYAILQVLSNQSEGYLCSSKASAFVAEGMTNSDAIQVELVAMQGDDLVHYYTIEEETDIIFLQKDEEGNPILDDGNVVAVLDEEGNPMVETLTNVVDEGWTITEKGRAALKGLVS
jgi:hypothetical protein